MARSGESCDSCNSGVYYVYASLRTGESQVQYLRCSACSHRPEDNKVVQSADSIRRRFTYLGSRLNLKRR